jgi:1-deoxy-D-xylulose-5-phosphate synthase
LDEEILREIANWHLPVFVYQPDMEMGGLTSAILEFFANEHLSIDCTSIGIKDEYIPHGAVGILRKKYGIDINSLFEQVLKVIGE